MWLLLISRCILFSSLVIPGEYAKEYETAGGASVCLLEVDSLNNVSRASW